MARFWGLIGVGLTLEGIAVSLIALPKSTFWHGVGWTLVVLGLLVLGAAVLARVHLREASTADVDASAHVSDSPVTATQTGAGSVSGSVIQNSRVSVTYTGTVEAEKPPERDFVDVGTEYLVGLLDQHTTIQAQKLLSPYMGRWIRVSGDLRDVTVHGDEIMAAIASKGAIPWLFLMFDRAWEDRLAGLPRGAAITVAGQIRSVGSNDVTLAACELEDAQTKGASGSGA